MTIKVGEQSYLTDNDLQVKILGCWPRLDIQNKKLKKIFKKNYGRSFLGGDEIVAYSQHNQLTAQTVLSAGNRESNSYCLSYCYIFYFQIFNSSTLQPFNFL